MTLCWEDYNVESWARGGNQVLSNGGRLTEVVLQVTLNSHLTNYQKININFKIIVLHVNTSLLNNLSVD